MLIPNTQAINKVAGLVQLTAANMAIPNLQIGDVFQVRRRFTTAEINAGAQLLAPIFGYKYRVLECTQIAIGGAASGATAVRLTATQSGATVAIVTTAVAALTQSTPVDLGAANAVVLADGLSFVSNDSNTGLNVDKTGGSLATSTAIDYIVLFAMDEG